MIWLQIVNSVAAFAAATIWWWVALTSQRLGVKPAVTFSALIAAVCVWYGIVYMLLGTGMLDMPVTSAVKLFRYIFIANVLAPALAAGTLVKAIHGPVKSLRDDL